jgi:hypothetical protein
MFYNPLEKSQVGFVFIIIIAISLVPLNISCSIKMFMKSSRRFSYSGAFETESSLEEN